MNKPLALFLLASSGAASAATISYSNTGTALGNSTYVDIALTKFDPSLGTLTGVTLTLNEFSVSGSFTATAASGSGVLNYFGTTATVRQKSTNLLGFSQQIGSASTDEDLVISPGVGYTLNQGQSQIFSITEYVFLSNLVSNISSANWAAYEGAGNVFLQLKNSPVASLTAETASFSTAAATSFADFTVTYTYTAAPVPEPSTYGIVLGGLALIGAVVARRRKISK